MIDFYKTGITGRRSAKWTISCVIGNLKIHMEYY
jgi:hypothetical protein